MTGAGGSTSAGGGGGGSHARSFLPSGCAQGWSIADKAQIDNWLARERGFRVFMFPEHHAQFQDPLLDYVTGKLVLRSGGSNITALE